MDRDRIAETDTPLGAGKTAEEATNLFLREHQVAAQDLPWARRWSGNASPDRQGEDAQEPIAHAILSLLTCGHGPADTRFNLPSVSLLPRGTSCRR
jgi:hypothetical protein